MDAMEYTIGDNIRAFRKERRLTQKQLSERLGVSSSLVSNWEKGINKPAADILADLCYFLFHKVANAAVLNILCYANR